MLKSLAAPRKGWGELKSSKLFVTLAGLVLVGWLTPAGFGMPGANDLKYFKATISPALVSAGSTESFTITITPCDTTGTNCSEANPNTGNQIGAVEIGSPAGYPVTGPVSATASNGQSWTSSTSNGIILLWPENGNGKIGVGEFLSVTFDWTVPKPEPCEEMSYTWTARGASSKSPQGTTTFEWNLVDASLTVTATCSAHMPVNKLIDGASANCTAITDGSTDPNGNPDYTRPCTYPGGLQFTSEDPEFEVNLYETDAESLPNPDPVSNIFDGGFYFPFPSLGPKVPPQFDPIVPTLPFPLTVCEAPAAPYILVGVEINVTPEDTNNPNPLHPAIYYHADPNNPNDIYACFNSEVPSGTTEFAVNLDNSTVCTYTQGGWGSRPHGQNPGWILSSNFTSATGGSVTIGGANSLTFNSAAAVEAFLPAGGPPSALTSSALNPTDGSNGGGVLAGQVLALTLNVDLGAAGAIGSDYTGGIGNFLVTEPTCYADTKPTVNEVLEDANHILGGGALPAPNGANCSYSNLNNLVTKLNQSFDNCTAGPDSIILTPRLQE